MSNGSQQFYKHMVQTRNLNAREFLIYYVTKQNMRFNQSKIAISQISKIAIDWNILTKSAVIH